MVKHVGTVISNELAEKLDIVARSEKKTVYKLVRELIEEYISVSTNGSIPANGNSTEISQSQISSRISSNMSSHIADVKHTSLLKEDIADVDKSELKETVNQKKVVFNVGFQPRTGLVLKASMPSLEKVDGIFGKFMHKKKNNQKN